MPHEPLLERVGRKTRKNFLAPVWKKSKVGGIVKGSKREWKRGMCVYLCVEIRVGIAGVVVFEEQGEGLTVPIMC